MGDTHFLQALPAECFSGVTEGQKLSLESKDHVTQCCREVSLQERFGHMAPSSERAARIPGGGDGGCHSRVGI